MLATICLLLLGTAACRDEAITGNAALIQDGVAISPASVQVSMGSTVQLVAQLFDDNGDVVPNQTFSWSTPDPAIATVDGNGVVSGVGLGDVIIFAITSDQSHTGGADVSVVNATGGGGDGGGGDGGGGGGGGGGSSTNSTANILDIPSNNSEAGANEPSGLTPMGLSHFSAKGNCAPEGGGGSRERCELSEGGVHFYGGNGNRATTTGSGRLRIEMPQGCMGNAGTSCGTMLTHAIAASPSQPNVRAKNEWRELYARVQMRVDDNYWVHPAGNKVLGPMFRSPTGGENTLGWVKVFPNGGDYWNGQRISNAPNPPHLGWAFGHQICGYPVNHRGSVDVPINQDFTVEYWIKMSSGGCTNDGAIKLWINGQLTVNLQNVPTWTGQSGNNEGGTNPWGLKIQHILGGVCDVTIAPCPSSGMFIEHDYLYMSAR